MKKYHQYLFLQIKLAVLAIVFVTVSCCPYGYGQSSSSSQEPIKPVPIDHHPQNYGPKKSTAHIPPSNYGSGLHGNFITLLN